MFLMLQQNQDNFLDKPARLSEPGKFIPVLYLLTTIFFLWSVYTFLHVVPNLQWSTPLEKVNVALKNEAWIHFIIFNCFFTMSMICYIRAVLTHPGEVPEGDQQFEYMPRDQHGNLRLETECQTVSLQETKKSGDRRHCKWCGKYKPDRCHHCRVCKCCILKMDHHCPWLYNCVGYFNYKYFFLWLFYSVLTLLYMVFTMSPSVRKIIVADTPFLQMFLLLFGETLGFALAMLVTCFWGFHVWLVAKAMSTIEFCEKSLPKKRDFPPAEVAANNNTGLWFLKNYDSSVYDLGLLENMKIALGDNILVMLLPVAAGQGDGLNFLGDATKLTACIKDNPGIRVKKHCRLPRSRSPSMRPWLQGDIDNHSYGNDHGS